MMVEPHEAVIAHATLRSITQWLGAPVDCARRPTSRRRRRPRKSMAPIGPSESMLEGVRETALAFGAAQDLFGILARAAPPQVAERRAETAVLMLRSAAITGSSRTEITSVRRGRWPRRVIARCGSTWPAWVTAAMPRTFPASMYARAFHRRRAGRHRSLAERGCKRFYLMGICSGSYVAFQTALADPRVTGQILMNPRLLEWEGKPGGWDDVMQRYYKSIAFYQRSLLKPDVYWRLARGQVDVDRHRRPRFRSVLQARFKRAIDRLLCELEVRQKETCWPGCATWAHAASTP